MLRNLGLGLAGLLMAAQLHANGIVGVLKVRLQGIVSEGGQKTFVFVANESQLRHLYGRMHADRNVIQLDVDGTPYYILVQRVSGQWVIDGTSVNDGERIHIVGASE